MRLPGRMDLYVQVSHQIREIFSRYTPLIEPLSLDEAFLDVSASEKLFGSAEHIAQKVKDDILNELELVASVGLAPSKFIAKIASDVNKPDGYVIVDPESVQGFLDPLPVGRIWGAGKVTVAAFDRMGIRTIGQLRRQSQTWLKSQFGQMGDHLWQLANGIDVREVKSEGQSKSISHETTFAVDLYNKDILEAWLSHLTEQVSWRLRKHELKGKTINLKVRHHDFKTITRAQSLSQATDSTDLIWQTVRSLFNQYWTGKASIRLVGMGVTGLYRHDQVIEQGDLFVSPEHTKIDKIADDINARFGATTLQRGRSKNRNN
ncbi:DNA polymerase IV [hydrothermal vent metagenome]|uniref:DNA-directed DNA polymerase n=1 Tax=hydrothermal vent metagenome TaxID=652676 RepID=A0A3B0ZVR7_9ZZZZ